MPNGINGIIDKFHLFIPKTSHKTRESTIFSYFFNSNCTITFQPFFFVSSKINVNNLVQGAEGSGRGGSFAFACHSHPPSLHLAVP